MMSTGINLVMTVIGFSLSVLFIVFVCTRLICARIHLNATRRSFARASRSDLSILERGIHGVEPLVIANFPSKKYKELCLQSKENAQCTICLSEYHDEDTLRILPVCGHSFHATCIDIWLQQHSTCPVCRISLRELPQKKWYMQPMFSAATRSQYTVTQQPVSGPHYCHCMGNRFRHTSRSQDNQITEHVVQDVHSEESDGVDSVGDGNHISVNHDQVLKDLAEKMVESPSSR